MVSGGWALGLGLVLGVCLARYVMDFNGALWQNPFGVYVAGCLSGVLLLPIATFLLKRIMVSKKDEDDHALYRLDHAILNVEVPPKTMWMNMGYWSPESSFPSACRALLDEVLKAAGLLDSAGAPSILAKSTSLKLIDLGFGCGDQSVYLTQTLRKADSPTHSLVDTYVGLTISPPQFNYAYRRLRLDSSVENNQIRLFCADAGKPDSWGNEIHQAVSSSSQLREDKSVTNVPPITWVLALDTLYHFVPSRKPIFNHAFEELHASIMAFDLLLADQPSAWDLLLLRIVSLFASTPFSNFLTVAQYKAQLVAAGYDSNQIEIQDISENVFTGMASFIQTKDRELKKMGMGIGRYKAAAKVFGWWARSGIVRGCIVIAKR